jgi:hypothetical protein
VTGWGPSTQMQSKVGRREYMEVAAAAPVLRASGSNGKHLNSELIIYRLDVGG